MTTALPQPVYADSSATSPDDRLWEVAELFKAALPPGELRAFSVHGLDRLDLPVEIASFQFPADHSAGPVQFDGFGYGLSQAEATVGAFGELTESAHCERDLSSREFVEGSYDEVVQAFGPRGVVDPLTLCLPAGSAYSPSQPLSWTHTVRWRTGERVLLPVEFAAVGRHQLRGRQPLITTITNGLGAGLSTDQALAHGLLELLQRDGNCTTFRALDRGIVIERDEIADEGVRALFDRLEAAGLQMQAKLASTEFGMVNAYVIGRDVQGAAMSLQATACGEAAHLDRERALRKAAVEFAAARSRKAFMHGPLDRIAEVAPDWYLPHYLEHFDPAAEEPRALEAMCQWVQKDQHELETLLAETVFAERQHVRLSELPTVPAASIADPADRCEAICSRLEAEGLEVLLVDSSPQHDRDGEATPVVALRAVVPGLEGETMSYGRLGERGVQRLLQRGVDFVGLGEPTGSRLPVLLTNEAQERLGGPAWFDPQRAADVVGDHYALYREPASHAVPVTLQQRSET